MEHEPPHLPASPPPAPASDRAHWTPAKQRIFLTALLETGSIARAAGAAGMSRSSAHRLRQRFAGTAFDRTWTQALAAYAAQLTDPFGTDAAAPPTCRRAAAVATQAPR